MAAVRRSSESGVVVALVVFVILAVAGVGSAIYFYQRYAQTRQAVATTQQAVQETIHAVFKDAGWSLTTREASPLGVEYTQESFGDVAARLGEAAEYEDLRENLLGWESIDGLRDAIRTAPVQKEAEAAGNPPMATLKGLLALYGKLYQQRVSEVASLKAQSQELKQQLNRAESEKTELENQLRAQLNAEAQSYKQKTVALQQSNDELNKELGRRSQQASKRQEEYQKQLNQANSKIASLQDQVEEWKERYWERVRGPEKRPQLQPDGKVIRLDEEDDFVYVEGGQDKGFRENERYVVFERMPSGEDRKKAIIVLGEVGEIVSRAAIVSEDQYVLEGDYFVSVARWDEFHGG